MARPFNTYTCKCGYSLHFCTWCEAWMPPEKFSKASGQKHYRNRCRLCESKRRTPLSIAWDKRKEAEANALNDRLTSLLKQAQKTPLTEEQWLEACKHFNGCALCDETHVEVRKFIVDFEKGGSYTVGNIVPLCSQCQIYTEGTSRLIKGSVARVYHKNLAGTRLQNIKQEKIKELVDYFEKKVLENVSKTKGV